MPHTNNRLLTQISRTRRGHAAFAPRIQGETLEPRQLLSVTPIGGPDFHVDAPVSTVAFIDSDVGSPSLLANEHGQAVYELDPNRNGIEQITDALRNHTDIVAIKIISHGNTNSLSLGNIELSAGNVSHHVESISSWSNALSRDADILIFGCRVASGSTTLVDVIADLSGADVAASTDLTGESNLGGDWDLEYSTGPIETDIESRSFGNFTGLLFKPYTHIAIADQVWMDVVDDGNISVNTADGRSIEVAVQTEVAEALKSHREFYNAGTIGPDGFPDIVMGQGTIHPEDHGRWIRHILDQAWKAQDDTNHNNAGTYTATEKQQILAYGYGFLTHSAGDVWAHTLVNEIATEAFPDLLTGAATAKKAQIVIDHLLIENYIGDATPGFDGNALASDDVVTRNGVGLITDVITDTTPAILFPTNQSLGGTTGGVRRFIYESTILSTPAEAGLPASRGFFIDTFLDIRAGLQNSLNSLTESPQELSQELLDDFAKIQNDLQEATNRFDQLELDRDAARLRFQEAEQKLEQANQAAAAAQQDLVDAENELADFRRQEQTLLETRNALDSAINHADCNFGDSVSPRTIFIPPFGPTVPNPEIAADIAHDTVACPARLIAVGFNGAIDLAEDTFNQTVAALEDVGRSIANAADAVADLTVAAAEAAAGFVEALPIKEAAEATLGLAEASLLAAGDTVASLTTAVGNSLEIVTASYFNAWIDDIDTGLQNWPEVGLRTTRALFDPQTKRDVQNFICDNEDGEGRRTCEHGVGLLDVFGHLVDTPPGFEDGNSFVDDHLLSMFGAPDAVGDVRSAVREFVSSVETFVAEVTAPIRDALAIVADPIEVTVDALKNQINTWLLGLVKEGLGIDIENLDLLLKSPSSKLSMKQIGADIIPSVGSSIPLFEQGDREKLDRYMVLMTDPADDGSDLHRPFEPVVDDVDVSDTVFHDNAVGGLKDDVEFDPAKFPAFANAVTMSKLILLDGEGMDGFTKQVAGENAPSLYTKDGKLGNIMLTTMPIDDVDADSTQWLHSIDGDHAWQRGRDPIFSGPSAGNGNFPLFEDQTLREGVFREIFLDWENDIRDDNVLNGSVVFPYIVDVTNPGDILVRVDGQDDGDGAAGDPPQTETVDHVIDNATQKHLNFRDLGSGFVVTPSTGPMAVTGLRFYTANDVIQRDPASYILEGTNGDGQFTVISEGELALPDARNNGGDTPINLSLAHQAVFFQNESRYVSYRLTFPTLKSAVDANSMQIAEVEFLADLDSVSGDIPGDSNRDGVFNSGDLVQVFIRKKYEDDIPNNATWGDGDWNGDGDFDTLDLVFAFQANTYVAAAKPFLARATPTNPAAAFDKFPLERLYASENTADVPYQEPAHQAGFRRPLRVQFPATDRAMAELFDRSGSDRTLGFDGSLDDVLPTRFSHSTSPSPPRGLDA